MSGGENLLVLWMWLDMLWMEVMEGGDAGCLADSETTKTQKNSWQGRCH